MKNSKNNNLPKHLIPFLWYFFKKYKFAFIFYIICVMVLNDISGLLIQPYLLKIFFDKLATNTITYKNTIYLIFGIAFSDFSYLSFALNTFLNFNSLTKVQEDIRTQMFTYCLSQSVNFFNNSHSGELFNKISAMTETINNALECVAELIKDIILLGSCIFIMFYYSMFLGITSIIWFTLCLIATYHLIFKKITNELEHEQQENNNLISLINDDFSNIQTIKSFPNKAHERHVFIEILKNKFKRRTNTTYYTCISDFVFFVLNFSFVCIVLFVIIYQLKHNITTIGNFVFILMLLKKLVSLSVEIGWFTDSLKDLAIIQNSLDIITNDIEIKNLPNATKLLITNGKIELKNISFKYD